MITLIGIAIIAVGFALRLNTLAVVVVAAIATGLAGGMHFNQVMANFGATFTTDRFMTLPIILTLPVIGLLERYGLKEQAEAIIKKAKAASSGKVILTYLFIRELSSALGLNIGGQAQAVRPLVAPMAESAAVAKYGDITEDLRQAIRAEAAVSENVGYFFGEDIFIATGAILLMKGFFESQGMHVGVWNMALWGLPTAISVFFINWYRLRRLDKQIDRKMRGYRKPTVSVKEQEEVSV